MDAVELHSEGESSEELEKKEEHVEKKKRAQQLSDEDEHSAKEEKKKHRHQEKKKKKKDNRAKKEKKKRRKDNADTAALPAAAACDPLAMPPASARLPQHPRVEAPQVQTPSIAGAAAISPPPMPPFKPGPDYAPIDPVGGPWPLQEGSPPPPAVAPSGPLDQDAERNLLPRQYNAMLCKYFEAQFRNATFAYAPASGIARRCLKASVHCVRCGKTTEATIASDGRTMLTCKCDAPVLAGEKLAQLFSAPPITASITGEEAGRTALMEAIIRGPDELLLEETIRGRLVCNPVSHKWHAWVQGGWYEGMTDAEIGACLHRRVNECFDYWIEHIPGCNHEEHLAIAPMLGTLKARQLALTERRLLLAAKSWFRKYVQWNNDCRLVAAANGFVVQLDNQLQCRLEQPTDYISLHCSVAWLGVEAQPAEYLDALKVILEDDQDTISLWQKLCGLILSGDRSEEVLLWLFGPGGNGKEMLLSFLQKLMGSYATELDPASVQEKKAHSSELLWTSGRRAIFLPEPDDGTFDWASLKRISGHKVSARAAHSGQEQSTGGTAAVVVWGQPRPRIPALHLGSVGRRLWPIELNVLFRRKDEFEAAEKQYPGRKLIEKIPDLFQKVWDSERHAYFAWVAQGYVRYTQERLQASARIRNVHHNIINDGPLLSAKEKNVAAFLAERTHDSGTTRATDLYNAYQGWAGAPHKDRASDASLAKVFKALLPNWRNKMGIIYGVRLLNPVEMQRKLACQEDNL